jgi:hypothetical protein
LCRCGKSTQQLLKINYMSKFRNDIHKLIFLTFKLLV